MKPKALAKLAALEKVNKQLLPHLTDDKISYSGPPLVPVVSSLTKGNTFDLENGALADLFAAKDATRTRERYLNYYSPWVEAAALARTETLPPAWTKAKFVEGRLEPLVNVEYVFVLRIERTDPSVDALSHTFDPGQITGEAHLFSVDDGKYYGGLRFSAAKNSTVEYSYKKGADESEKQARAVEMARSSLEAYAREGFSHGVRKHVAGAAADWRY